MTARTVSDNFRSQSGRQTVIAVLVAAHLAARDTEFLCQRYALMTLRARVSGHRA